MSLINAYFKEGPSISLDRLVYAELINLSRLGIIRSFHINDDGTCIINDHVNCDVNSDLDTVIKLVRRGWRFSGTYYFKDFGGFSVKFRHLSTPSIIEIFEYDTYSTDIDGDVVDVGSNIGDSTIYFILKGARRVVAIEPVKVAYLESLVNFRLNNIANKVLVLNRALSSKHSVIRIPRMGLVSSGHYTSYGNEQALMKFLNQLLPCDFSYSSVETVTLRDALSLIDEPYLLKLDCEGCEYDVILNDYESVKSFNELIIEYHSGIMGLNRDILINKLSRDFKCRVDPGLSTNTEKIGLIKCIKK